MAKFHTFSGQTFYLSGSISSTATSITLSSFAEPVTGTLYTMALIDSDIVYGTIAPKTTTSELISFTGITQNANGTATLTGVTRGLAKKSPFTTDSAYKLPHSGQSQFIISDAPQVFEQYDAKVNAETISGVKSFTAVPNSSAAPVSGNDLANKTYVDSVVGGITTVNQLLEAGTAGETVAAGNLIYFSETDNEWLKTDADTLATVFNVKLGIAMGAGVNGGAISGGVLTRGTYTTSGLTQGDLVYASNTAGAFACGTVGTTPRVIGIANSTTLLYFDPDFQNRLYNYAVDSVGTDAYAVTLAGAYGAYYPGMIVAFKAGTANTGAATLAINGGTAKSIVRDASAALATGDIVANQVCYVVYDGTNFQLMNPGTISLTTQASGVLPIANGGTGLSTTASYYNSGVITRQMDAASGAVTTAHGLGVTPKRIKLQAMGGSASTTLGDVMLSVGTYDGTNIRCIYSTHGVGTATLSGTDTSNILFLTEVTNGKNQSAVPTFDATNITLTWTKSASAPSSEVIPIIWEAWGY